jgi:hypothetical protein
MLQNTRPFACACASDDLSQIFQSAAIHSTTCNQKPSWIRLRLGKAIASQLVEPRS